MSLGINIDCVNVNANKMLNDANNFDVAFVTDTNTQKMLFGFGPSNASKLILGETSALLKTDLSVTGTLNATTIQENGNNLSTQYALSNHTHNASAITSGTINANILPAASTSQPGIVQLVNSVTSTSNDQAATANAVKTAYDLANAALPKAGGTVSGVVTVNNTLTASRLGVGTSSPSFTTHVVGSIFIGDISYASTSIPSSSATVSSTYNSYRLVFDNTYDDTSRANKIVLHNANGMLGGFGIRTGTVTYHTGSAHSFYAGATSTVDGNLKVKFGDDVAVTVYGKFYFNGAPAGTLYTDGNGMVYAASDKRAKFNIEYLDQDDTSYIDKVLALKPARFELYSDPGKPKCGFITQDVDPVIPEAVDGRKYQFYFKKDVDGNTVYGVDGEPVLDTSKPRYQALDTTAILAHVVGAFKELYTEVVELRREINILKNP